MVRGGRDIRAVAECRSRLEKYAASFTRQLDGRKEKAFLSIHTE